MKRPPTYTIFVVRPDCPPLVRYRGITEDRVHAIAMDLYETRMFATVATQLESRGKVAREDQ
jgi:hypothetical protein